MSLLDPLYEKHAELIAARVADILRDNRQSLVVPEYVDQNEAARLLGLSVRTLENFRYRDGCDGPTFSKIGQLVRYRVADLRDWMARHQGGEK